MIVGIFRRKQKGNWMKKKVLKLVIVVPAVILLLLVGWYVLFSYFGIGPAFPYMNAIVIESHISSEKVSETEPLLALTENEEAAREIAEQYGITFVTYQNGVATYYTDEDPNEVIIRGEENGYPTLYINYQRNLSDL